MAALPLASPLKTTQKRCPYTLQGKRRRAVCCLPTQAGRTGKANNFGLMTNKALSTRPVVFSAWNQPPHTVDLDPSATPKCRSLRTRLARWAQKNTQTNKQTNKQTDRQTDKQTNKQANNEKKQKKNRWISSMASRSSSQLRNKEKPMGKFAQNSTPCLPHRKLHGRHPARLSLR